MRKILIVGFLLGVLLASCGGVRPASTPEPEPTASPSAPEVDPPIRNSSIPYGKNIRFEHLSLEQGLSQSVVNVIMQDRTGFLWVGTDDGLNRFDGYNFKVYKPDADDPQSLSDRTITDIVEDQQGNLWIGTRQGGLNRYNPITGKFTQYLHDRNNDLSITGGQVTELCLDKNGLWIGTNNGLDFLDFQTNIFTHYRDTPDSPVQLGSNFITTLYLDSKDNLWIGTVDTGLNIMNKQDGKVTIYRYNKNRENSLSHNRVLSIAERPNGEVWVGTANGLNRFNPADQSFTRFLNEQDKPESLAGGIVYSLFTDHSGTLWVGTNNGLDRYDLETNSFIHHQYQPSVPGSLSHNEVYSIFEDSSGVLWIGTLGGGLNKYNRQQDRFAYYRNNPDDPASLSSNFIFSILADGKDSVWVGTINEGLNHFDPTSEIAQVFKHDPEDPTSISSDNIIALYRDSNGVLWVGTGSALDRYNPTTNSFSHFEPSETGVNETTRFAVFAIYEDANGVLWVGSNRGLMLFDRKKNTFLRFQSEDSKKEDLSNNKINVILEDNKGNLWVGTFDDGLKRINKERDGITDFRHDPSNPATLSNNSVMCIYQDSKGTLWVGTHGGGLSRYNPGTGTFTHFTENEGLPNNVIYGILEDDQGNLWLSTNFGLSRFDPKTQTFRNFTASDGLQSNEFNQNAYSADPAGVMYFGGINGLNIFMPREIKDNPITPGIAITAITLDGVPLTSDRSTEYLDAITMEWPRDSFEFEFASFSFEQPSKNQYAYMLEGFDSNWINIDTQRNGRYTNLPGGTYTLRLRGSNSDGVWNEQGIAMQVVVVPPFWETWWFGSLMLVTFIITLAGGLRWRVKNIERQNRELERLVQKRTADLEKRTGEIEALYQADEKILRSVTLNHIFQTLVDVSISILKADRSVVFTWNEARRKIVPRVSRGFQAETLSVLTFEIDEGMIGIAMKTGQPVVESEINMKSLRENIRAALLEEGIQSYAHFPIVVDGKVVAIFNVAYTRPNALTKDSVRLFTALVNRASLSIANMELFEQTKDLAVMEERNRLARDLHDSAKQKAFAALAQLGTVNGMSKLIPQEISPHVGEAETLIYEVIQELNFLIQEIYPIALQEKGLQTTLREYVFEWEHRNDAMVNLTIQNDRSLPLETEQAVYRVIQEALANIARHSKAKRADVSLVYNHEVLQVVVSDDGCGFDMNQKAKGLGFRSMRERIGSIRGTLQVQSAPGQGTRLIIQIPIRSNTGD